MEQDDVVAITPGDSLLKPAEVLAACENVEAIRHFSVPKDGLSLIFRLMQVQGVPAWANSFSVAIQDVIQVKSKRRRTRHFHFQ